MQRIIAYIYRYKGEENLYRKCGNVGFCRVEELGGKRIINMCFKETHSITRQCEISDIYLDNKEDKNVCRCKVGKKLRNENVCDGQMRIKMQGEKEDGLYISCGNERYIVLWHGDKEALLFQQDVQQDKEVEEDVISTKYKNNADQLLRAYNRLAKSPMIIENDMQQVAKLKPQQMIMLPRKYWRLTNNRFLMECFYMHKHILFFRYKGCYVIGVPSIGCENEQIYAKQFGFQETIMASEYNKPSASKMYWLYNLE